MSPAGDSMARVFGRISPAGLDRAEAGGGQGRWPRQGGTGESAAPHREAERARERSVRGLRGRRCPGGSPYSPRTSRGDRGSPSGFGPGRGIGRVAGSGPGGEVSRRQDEGRDHRVRDGVRHDGVAQPAPAIHRQGIEQPDQPAGQPSAVQQAEGGRGDQQGEPRRSDPSGPTRSRPRSAVGPGSLGRPAPRPAGSPPPSRRPGPPARPGPSRAAASPAPRPATAPPRPRPAPAPSRGRRPPRRWPARPTSPGGRGPPGHAGSTRGPSPPSRSLSPYRASNPEESEAVAIDVATTASIGAR